MGMRTVPAGTATLEHLRAGQRGCVRAVLDGGECQGSGEWPLQPGALVRCRERRPEGVVIETTDGEVLVIPWEWATYIRIERIGGAGDWMGAPRSARRYTRALERRIR
jgi:hypothetical protein